MPSSLRSLCTAALLLSASTLGAPASPEQFPLSIQAMRERSYPGSVLTLERTLPGGVNYTRSVVSYRSDGLKIYALLTVPRGTPPGGGWPAIVFNHGYIPPELYRTTQRYVAYQDAFARAGFVTLKSDYRGHGSSQGEALGGYWSPDYTVDVLNAAASLRKRADVNGGRIGMWGHSMGGSLTLRAMVVDPRIKAGVIWAGVVAPYEDIVYHWPNRHPVRLSSKAVNRRKEIQAKYGTPKSNPAFYRAIEPNTYLSSLKGRPLQLHHGTADEDVPLAFSKTLASELKAVGEPTTLYTYPGDNHNLSKHLSVALRRSVEFFKKTL